MGRTGFRGLALAACLPLAACGGGGDHPAATPAPPAAPASYDRFDTLNRDVTLATGSTAVGYSYSTTSGNRPGSVARDAKGGFGDGGVTISYDAASRTYTLHDGANAISYAPADRQPAAPGADPTPFDSYRHTSGSVTDTVYAYRAGSAATPFPQLSYTTFVVANRQTVTSLSGISDANIDSRTVYAIGGFETVRSDLPRTGTASYTTFLAGAQVDSRRDVAGTATATADFGAATLNTTLALTAGGQPIGSFAGTAAIDAATPHFRGDLAAGGATQGSFSGSFFGPQAAELGYTFRVQSSIGTIDGGVVGRK